MKNKVVDLQQICKPIMEYTVVRFIIGLISLSVLVIVAGALFVGWVLGI